MPRAKDGRVPFPDPIPESLQGSIERHCAKYECDPELFTESFRDWANASGHQYKDWGLVAARALREGWSWTRHLLPSPPGGGARARVSPTYAERVRDANRDVARAGANAEDPDELMRRAVLYEMFTGLGQPIVEERMTFYLDVTRFLPSDVYRDSVMAATAANTSGFPPSPGAILDAGRRFAPAPMNPGYERGNPKWYRQAIGQMTRRERPKEIAARGNGPSRPTFKLEPPRS